MYNTNFDGSEKIRIRKKEENSNGNERERGRKGRIFFQIIVSTVGSLVRRLIFFF